ncbi:UDP-N-acetylmuramate dehydrogenase [Niabella ginsengisoli]|uniref:UDP-N-acetylenolpyruvoylglucosamine reductase n=1 Tax=Niabella ginsengisoli TaxID=522298 RepID=A0ABS9SHD8_9BACT|nr:UDP-N-acetylmuramate dehydrogenase [Niabella ginsengisoli]MCH5597574.1 UDP-N-acetylmuramate dehydrogenase [Niabella ginsengisoli]
MSVLIESNVSLKSRNTFGISAYAQYFTVADSVDVLREGMAWALKQDANVLIVGGGSNMLFTNDVQGLVIQNGLKGIEKIAEDEDFIYLKVGAGVVWHQLVLYCLEHNYAGIENLALIPGLVGASPMQNIGAYGVEIKEVFHELTTVHRKTLEEITFSNAACEFGYRESVFKHKFKNQFVITDVTYKLRKEPQYHIEYGAIKQELEKANVNELSIQAIANAVIAIRTSKLPDPKQIGNAGSFFKNPSVSKEKFQNLKEAFPEIVAYENPDHTMKLAAGWLIEQCGLKGYRKGDAGVHAKQALVLVNYGDARGSDILEVCKLVQDAVLQRFSVELLPEVNIL